MHLYFFIQRISLGLGQNKVTSSDFQKGTSSISDCFHQSIGGTSNINIGNELLNKLS